MVFNLACSALMLALQLLIPTLSPPSLLTVPSSPGIFEQKEDAPISTTMHGIVGLHTPKPFLSLCADPGPVGGTQVKYK